MADEQAKTETTAPEKVSMDKNTVMAALAYIGPLVIVSYITAKDDPFVKFHIKQGLALFVAEVALWFILGMVPYFWLIILVRNLAILGYSILGIVNVVQKKEKELPIIGAFSKYFNF